MEPFARGSTLNDLGTVVHVNALRSPDSVAVKVPGGGSRTYLELDERSNRLANALRGLGLDRGDRIAAWLDDICEYVEFYVAVAKANLVAVPLNAALTRYEAEYQIELTGASTLLYTPSQAERLEELEQRDELTLIAVQPRVAHRGLEYERLLKDASAARTPAPPTDDVWAISFTSGTTGHPKGAMLTHRSSMTLGLTQQQALRIPVSPVNIRAVSMSFPATVQSHMVPHLLAGGTEVLAAGPWDSERILGLVAAERGTHIYVPNPVMEEFAEVAAANPSLWQTLTSVLHAGQRQDPKILEKLADVIGTRYLAGWGMTEISGGLSTCTTAVDALLRPDHLFETCGRPVPGTMIAAVDDDRSPLPRDRDSVGELALLSPSLFAGYWDNPAATDGVLENGWYFSGDVGSIDRDGYVYIADRRTNMILSGGANIYPAELEMVIDRCPGIVECAVVAGPHPRWGQTPVAVVVREADADLTEDQVIEYARERLASYKKPTRVIFVDQIPRTTGGKTARGRLKDQLAPLLAEPRA